MWTITALAAGLLLRLWFVQHAPAVAGDALVYGGIAKNLLQKGIYGFNEEISNGSLHVLPSLIRLPGYPLFLAVCFRIFGMEHYRSAIYIQVLVDLWTCLLAAGLARRVFGLRAWLPALVAAALCPFTANYVATPITETVVLWTIALAFYALRRWQEEGAGLNRWVGVIGAALAYSLLLRPEQGLLSAAVVPAMIWISWQKRRRGAAAHGGRVTLLAPLIVSLCVVLPLVPWTIRNERTFGVFQPLAPRSAADPGERSPTGFNLWYRTWGIDFVSTDEVYWNVNGAAILPGDLPNRAFALGCSAGRIARSELPLYGRTLGLLQDYNQSQIDSPALDVRFAELAHERIAAAPLCYGVLLPLARLGNMLVRPRLELTRLPDRWWEAPVVGWKLTGVLLYAGLDVGLVLAAIAGIARGFRVASADSRVLLWSTVAMVLLRVALLLTLDNSEPRYTLEFFPVFFVWIGALFSGRGEAPG